MLIYQHPFTTDKVYGTDLLANNDDIILLGVKF